MSNAFRPSAIYSFGDSLSDAGDHFLLSSSPFAGLLGMVAKPVSPPYFQQTYAAVGGGTLTADVYSNGPVWVQYLAGDLGLATPAPGEVGATADTLFAGFIGLGYSAGEAQSLVTSLEEAQGTTGGNPYLQLVAGAAGGTDFAVGGSITGPSGFNSDPTMGITDLAAQVASFQAEVPTPSPSALYTIWSGNNDVLNLAQASNIDTLMASGAATADIAQSAANEVAAVGSLVASGARDVIVLGVSNLGLTPGALGLGSADSTITTQLSQLYNADLAGDLAATRFGAAEVTLVSTFATLDAVVANPAAYGLADVTDPVYSGSSSSYDPSKLVSTVPSVQNSYLFFDVLHPTSTGQQIFANLVEASLTSPACFAAGSRIATPRGPRPVETLRPGDEVTLQSGEAVPVTWIGHRSVTPASLVRPADAWPVRIAAHAFAPGVPSRDLRLSPDHAVWCDGALIPVRYLINGRTVAAQPCDRVTYFHLELARHDIVLAEGLPCESYLDTGNRADFENAGLVTRLRPEFALRTWQDRACAPLVLDGPRLAAARAGLLDRAPLLGHALTDDPALQIIADGRKLRVAAQGAVRRAHVPAGTSTLRLVSRAAIPAETRADSAEHRRLGIAVRACATPTVPSTSPAPASAPAGSTPSRSPTAPSGAGPMATPNTLALVPASSKSPSRWPSATGWTPPPPAPSPRADPPPARLPAARPTPRLSRSETT
jgi:phospholipase/lecithinase/hemolysin